MIRNRGFNIAVLAASIALAMGSNAALVATAPTATQLPGQGAVTTNGSVNAGDITGGVQSINISDNAVINWGSGSDINAAGPAGFNIGSSASLSFDGEGGSVLNIDSSGNASQIFGSLRANGTNVFVANTNGIIVGSTAQISGGSVSLIANTLSSDAAVAANDFVDRNILSFDGGGGDVTVQQGASISASTLLVSGGSTVNVNLNAFTAGDINLMVGTPSCLPRPRPMPRLISPASSATVIF